MPLEVVPLSLRRMSRLEPWINPPATPQLQSAPETPVSASLDWVSLSLPNTGLVSPWIVMSQPQEALRQLRWSLWSTAQLLDAFAWSCGILGCYCATISRSCADLSALSLLLCFFVLTAPQLQLRPVILSLLANPTLENRMIDHLV